MNNRFIKFITLSVLLPMALAAVAQEYVARLH